MNSTLSEQVNKSGVRGLSLPEVANARKKWGWNEVIYKEHALRRILKEILGEPMMLLLIAGSAIYFITGQTSEGIFMLLAVIAVYSISIYQDTRNRKALKLLTLATAPQSYVIRDGQLSTVLKREIVVGDCVLVEEGNVIPADGKIVYAHDFSVNESNLTGESIAVVKNDIDAEVFQGTNVVAGLSVFRVTKIGAQTEFGKIGKSLAEIKEVKTPLQLQIESFVRAISYVGLVIFLIVWGWNFYLSKDVVDSLLKAVSLGMSIIPEEIPVAFTTFMAVGAWKLVKYGIVVKKTSTIEALGSATTICLDKTGTITENRMSLAAIYSIAGNKISKEVDASNIDVITTAMWASEPVPFDPMEAALHEAYGKSAIADERNDFRFVHEYPLEGVPPMMTHVFENSQGQRIIAAKGAIEAILRVSSLSAEQKQQVENISEQLTVQGFRVLGVASSSFSGNKYPASQQEFPFTFSGLVAFYDPPKQNISEVFNAFYDAGIKVMILTGDNLKTTLTIAKQVGFRNGERSLTGQEVMDMNDSDLQSEIKSVTLFSRMFPGAKLKVLNALKANGEIVAMTGDGVNDGPALKAAHVGVAMGKKGAALAKDAASLVLTDDDLSHMIDAIAVGRRIYNNLKKAIQYIVSIHIPIILTVFIPLILGWVFPNIFTPVHIIFLELIMGPTCSIVYENEPIEPGTMKRPPRPFTLTFFNRRELGISVLQGAVITMASLLIYQFAVLEGFGEDQTRTLIFTVLISSNLFLTLVNRSFDHTIFETFTYKNRLLVGIILITVILSVIIFNVPVASRFFGLSKTSPYHIAISIVGGAISVLWIELVKWRNITYHRARQTRTP